MTQTNTDYLVQVTTAVTDRTYGAAGVNDKAGGFDNHLSQAATLSGDDSRNPSSGSQRTDTARLDRDDRSWITNGSKQSSHDGGNTTSSQTAPSDREDSAEAVSGSQSPMDDADGDDHETDKADDTTAAEAAGASQSAKDNQPKSASKPESKANTGKHATAKAAAANKKTAAEAGEGKATGATDGQAAGSSPSENSTAQHADEVATLVTSAATEIAKTVDESVESKAAVPEDKQSKGVKRDTSTAKSSKGSGASSEVAVCDDQSVAGAGTGETPLAAVKTINESAEASPALAGATTVKGKSEVDEPSDDDSHNDTRAGARNEASVQENKVDTAQLAVSPASPTDASANIAPKGKDAEQSAKPITAKGEPAAAAFARMTRNNITDASDSASGTNDLPQIDPSRFIGRVAKAFQTAQDRGGTLQLRLSPPELGAMRIELTVKDGVMSASLQTETANARRLLLDHLPALRDRLAEQNIRVDRFDVDVRREGTGGHTDARGSQQQQFQHEPDQPAPRRQAQSQTRTREAITPERTVATSNVSDTGLNLIV